MSSLVLNMDLCHKQGYLYPFTIYEPEETQRLRELYWRLHGLLPKSMSTQAMDWWHGQDHELWEICTNPRILDLVEPILGPDFYLWGHSFSANILMIRKPHPGIRMRF